MDLTLRRRDYFWIDCIRGIATFMVVFLHSAAPLLYKYKDLPLDYWMAGNIYDSLVRVCVPLFFMISGALLLCKDEPILLFFSKRLKRILIPSMFWSLFFVFWKAFYGKNLLITPFSFYSLLWRPSYYHLWFIYVLLGIYLYMPIIRKVIKIYDDSILIYYVFVWFLVASVLFFSDKFGDMSIPIYFRPFSGYLGYLVLGYLLSKRDYQKRHGICAFLIFIIFTFLTAYGTYLLTVNNEGIFVGYLYGYLTPNVILASISSFILIKYLVHVTRLAHKAFLVVLIKSISDCSFGIYFLHTVFLRLLQAGDLGFTLSAFISHPMYSVPLTAIITFVLSYFLVLLLCQVPTVRRVVS